MAKPPPLVTDVPIPEPPSRFVDPESNQDALQREYGAVVQIALLERQARAALLGISGLTDLTAVTTLSLTAAAGYVQADFQQVIDKLNAVIALQGQIVAALAEIKSEATTHLESLQPDPDSV
jgi:hypothetical protein